VVEETGSEVFMIDGEIVRVVGVEPSCEERHGRDEDGLTSG
jgi:hypothetical protein